MTDPIREAAEAAMERTKCALECSEECWRLKQDDTDKCGCGECIQESLATLRTIIDGYAAVCAAPDPHPCDICVQHPKGYGCGKECPAMELWRTREAARDSLATLSTKVESMGGEG